MRPASSNTFPASRGKGKSHAKCEGEIRVTELPFGMTTKIHVFKRVLKGYINPLHVMHGVDHMMQAVACARSTHFSVKSDGRMCHARQALHTMAAAKHIPRYAIMVILMLCTTACHCSRGIEAWIFRIEILFR